MCNLEEGRDRVKEKEDRDSRLGEEEQEVKSNVGLYNRVRWV